jgi:hypothetical protein
LNNLVIGKLFGDSDYDVFDNLILGIKTNRTDLMSDSLSWPILGEELIY